jgi:hypothetical protein
VLPVYKELQGSQDLKALLVQLVRRDPRVQKVLQELLGRLEVLVSPEAQVQQVLLD